MSATLLAVGAHPDDETMFAGGTLAWATARGLTVRVLSVTRGEGGEVGDPPVTTQESLGAAREAELRAAVAALGLDGVDFLPFRDPLVQHAGPEPAPASALFRIAATPEEFEGALVASIRALRPAVLLTHGAAGEYGHPQHVYTHETVRRAFDSAADGARFPEAGSPHTVAALYTWAAGYPTGGDARLERLLNTAELADWIVELDDAMLDRKEEAALAHRSQNALFLRHAEGKPLRAMLLRRESLRRVAAHAEVPDPLAALLAGDPLVSSAR
jgi:N-acetyl-1-D-myo-inositol-2-amino-2-deoxy-alpha-D-glucopyranoside deacetylase